MSEHRLPVEPADIRFDSLEDAHAARDALVVDLQGIESQLGDRDRRAQGERMDGRDYWQWRRKAMAARRIKLRQMQAIKAEIRRLDPPRDAPNRDVGRAICCITNAEVRIVSRDGQWVVIPACQTLRCPMCREDVALDRVDNIGAIECHYCGSEVHPSGTYEEPELVLP